VHVENFWLQQAKKVKKAWSWAETIHLEQIKPQNQTWFDFFKTRYTIILIYEMLNINLLFVRVHPLMLDELWFNKVTRNAESKEDVEEAAMNFKINVQMDLKHMDESMIKACQADPPMMYNY